MSTTHEMIAKKLGINRTTVTKALKGDLSIKKGTRKKVLEAAALMGYDFKQSQQNRRDGTRYFVHEEVHFKILDEHSGDVLHAGTATLTNLSTTGAMIQMKGDERTPVPLSHFHVEIQYQEDSELKTLPRARVVRITFYNAVEMGTKFLEGTGGLTPEFLKAFEARAFSRLK